MSSLVVVEASELERLTLDDAAHFLRFTPERILELVRDRGLPAGVGPDGTHQFSKEAMLAWVTALPSTPPPKPPRAKRGRCAGRPLGTNADWWAQALSIGVPRDVLVYGGTEADFVYFIQAGDAIKIGLARNVAARLARLQVGCPLELRLVASLRGTRAVEQWLHQRYWRLSIRGEWFKHEGELRWTIQTLQSTDATIDLEGT